MVKSVWSFNEICWNHLKKHFENHNSSLLKFLNGFLKQTDCFHFLLKSQHKKTSSFIEITNWFYLTEKTKENKSFFKFF